MLLSESHKKRLQELAGINIPTESDILLEIGDLYANSSKRVKFDMNIMKQAIEGGLEVGLIFQSNNDKYKMPIWKTRIVQPVAMGYDKKGQLVIRGIHVEGQSEKKAIETGVRSAQAKNEWRLFKAANIKSMFMTGRMFSSVALPGYNPNDSAMTDVIVSFSPEKARTSQDKLNAIKKGEQIPAAEPAKTIEPKQPTTKAPEAPKTQIKPQAKTTSSKAADDAKKLKDKIDKLNKMF